MSVPTRRGSEPARFTRHLIAALVCCLVLAFGSAAFGADRPETIELSHDPGFDKQVGPHAVHALEGPQPLAPSDAIARLDWRPVGDQPMVGLDLDDRLPSGWSGLTRSRPVWMWASVRNPTDLAGRWRLDLRLLFLVEEVSVHVRRPDGAWETVLDFVPPSATGRVGYLGHDLSADLRLGARQSADVLVRYVGAFGELSVPQLSTLDALQRRDTRDLVAVAVFLSVMGTVALYAIFNAASIGRRNSALFVGCILAWCFIVLSQSGHHYPYLAPNLFDALLRLEHVAVSLLVTLILMFGQSLFDLPQSAPRLNGVANVVVALNLLDIGTGLLIDPYERSVLDAVTPGLVLVSLILHLVICTRAALSGQRGAIPYLFSVLLVVPLSIALLHGGLEPVAVYHAHYVTMGLALCEIVAFVSAMAVRTYGLRKDRDTAKAAQLQATQERLRVSEELQRRQRDYERARQQARSTQDRLASVSHDILQPLMAMKVAMTSDTTTGSRSDSMRGAIEYLERLARSELSDPALADPRDAVAEADVGTEVFPLTLVTDSVAELFRPDAEARGLTFRYRPHAAFVRSDPVRLMRMVSNLVSNAIRHTSSGGVLLAGRRRGGAVEIGVWDTGSGMTEAELAEFVQPQRKGASSEGSGLGLHLVSQQAERLGHTLEIRSRPGVGTRATIRVEIGGPC